MQRSDKCDAGLQDTLHNGLENYGICVCDNRLSDFGLSKRFLETKGCKTERFLIQSVVLFE